MPPVPTSRLQGGLISLLICIQFVALDILTRLAVKQMLRGLAIPPAWWTQAIHIAVDMLLLVCLWVYYDSIDDRGFAEFCQSSHDRPLWDIPAFGTGLTVTAIIASPILCFSMHRLLTTVGVHSIVAAIPASAGAVGFTVGVRMALLARLRNIWAVQKDLVTGREKKHHPVSRILYALVFFLALGLAVWVVIGMAGHQIIKIGGTLIQIPVKVFAGLGIAILLFHTVHLLRRIRIRRRFLVRLEKLSHTGCMDYTVEGHPYLSLLSSRLYAGLTVTHRTKQGNLNRQTVYRVGLINGKSRRSILILCHNQVYRFLHRLPNQHLARRTGTHGSMLYKPTFSWFESHAFDFPEGEGTPILLIDPFPAVLAGQDEAEEWFFALDIGCHAFGYTTHSLGSFLRLLERSESQ
ncbi:MAG: hypothetical protein IJX72_03995 [Clostridia bacterium]|nr:hypothetical protein [Clostridia bacterium]